MMKIAPQENPLTATIYVASKFIIPWTIKDVYSLLYDRTGIAIPEVETLISNIS